MVTIAIRRWPPVDRLPSFYQRRLTLPVGGLCSTWNGEPGVTPKACGSRRPLHVERRECSGALGTQREPARRERRATDHRRPALSASRRRLLRCPAPPLRHNHDKANGRATPRRPRGPWRPGGRRRSRLGACGSAGARTGGHPRRSRPGPPPLPMPARHRLPRRMRCRPGRTEAPLPPLRPHEGQGRWRVAFAQAAASARRARLRVGSNRESVRIPGRPQAAATWRAARPPRRGPPAAGPPSAALVARLCGPFAHRGPIPRNSPRAPRSRPSAKPTGGRGTGRQQPPTGEPRVQWRVESRAPSEVWWAAAERRPPRPKGGGCPSSLRSAAGLARARRGARRPLAPPARTCGEAAFHVERGSPRLLRRRHPAAEPALAGRSTRLDRRPGALRGNSNAQLGATYGLPRLPQRRSIWTMRRRRERGAPPAATYNTALGGTGCRLMQAGRASPGAASRRGQEVDPAISPTVACVGESQASAGAGGELERRVPSHERPHLPTRPLPRPQADGRRRAPNANRSTGASAAERAAPARASTFHVERIAPQPVAAPSPASQRFALQTEHLRREPRAIDRPGSPSAASSQRCDAHRPTDPSLQGHLRSRPRGLRRTTHALDVTVWRRGTKNIPSPRCT